MAVTLPLFNFTERVQSHQSRWFLKCSVAVVSSSCGRRQAIQKHGWMMVNILTSHKYRNKDFWFWSGSVLNTTGSSLVGEQIIKEPTRCQQAHPRAHSPLRWSECDAHTVMHTWAHISYNLTHIQKKAIDFLKEHDCLEVRLSQVHFFCFSVKTSNIQRKSHISLATAYDTLVAIDAKAFQVHKEASRKSVSLFLVILISWWVASPLITLSLFFSAWGPLCLWTKCPRFILLVREEKGNNTRSFDKEQNNH